MEQLRRLAGLLVGSGLIVALDQVTKNIVRNRLAFGQVYEPIPELAPFLRIVHWRNTGAAFGIFPDGGIIFAVIAFLVIGAILYYYPQIPIRHRLLRWALMLQLAGAIGNLIDRLTLGPVTDFIAVGSFPVFNVADASISVGVGLLILSMWLEGHEQEGAEEAESIEQVSEAEPEVG
ncbi:MAG: signal peptidase II [Anaerolineales bacterium]